MMGNANTTVSGRAGWDKAGWCSVCPADVKSVNSRKLHNCSDDNN